MKTVVLILLSILAVPAQALDFEFGYGQTHFKHDHNGRWYVEGYPRLEELKDTALSFGVSHKFGSLRYRVEYLNLGEARLTSQFPSDLNYTPFDNSKPVEALIFGRGKVAGGLLSVSRDTPVFGLPLYVEVGAFVHRPEWRVYVYEPKTMQYCGEFARDGQLRVGPVLGIGVRHGALDIGIRYLHLEAGGDVPTYYVGAYTGVIKFVF